MTVLDAPTTRVSTDSYPFENADYIALWWRHLARKFDTGARKDDLVVHNRAFAKGLLKLRELRIATWNNAWAQDLTTDRLEALKSMSDWDCFRMTWAESRAPLQQFDALQAAGYEVIQQPAPPQYVCDISSGLEAYLKTLSHNSRKSFTKRVRKTDHLNPRLETIAGAAEIDAFFREFFNIHIPYWTEKEGYSYFSDPMERDFIVAWAKALDANGQLVAHRLKMNDETVNLNLGVACGDTLYWLLTINTGAHHEYGPGIVALYKCLQDTEARGLKRFNMGAGDYFYKVQAANHIEKCHTATAINPASLKGKAYKLWLSRQMRRAAAVEVKTDAN